MPPSEDDGAAYSLPRYFVVSMTGFSILSSGKSSSGSGMSTRWAANSEVHTTSVTSTSYASDLVWAFWIIFWRCESASSGSSMRRAFSSGWSSFHLSRTPWTKPEVSLPWTRVIGPLPSIFVDEAVSEPPSSPPPQAASPKNVVAATATAITLRRMCGSLRSYWCCTWVGM